jgi:hypothetical protein
MLPNDLAGAPASYKFGGAGGDALSSSIEEVVDFLKCIAQDRKTMETNNWS